MKRFVTLLLAILSLAATVIGGLAWINNLWVVWLWYRDLNAGNWQKFTGTGQLYQGPIGWLNWSAVDLSTVTTFIPFFGSLLIFLGFVAILRGRKIVNPDFPFFRAYDRVTVSLGLIGTLWGIIVIGYYPIKTIRMSMLMLSLHTALFSTLMAVAWVFIVVLLIVKPFMRWWAEYAGGKATESPGDDLIMVFEKLRQAAYDNSNVLNNNRRVVDDFSSAMREAQKIVLQFGAELKQHAAAINSAEDSMLKLLAEGRRERDSQLELLRQLTGIVDRIDKHQQEIVQRLNRLEQERRELENDNNRLTEKNRQLQSERERLEQDLRATADKLTRIKNALE